MLANVCRWVMFAIGTSIVLSSGCGELGLPGGGSADLKIIPASLSLDVAEFPEDQTDGGNSYALAVTSQPATGSALLHMIGGTVVHRSVEMVDRGLALIGKLNTDAAKMDGTTLAGTFRVAGKSVPYKADFGAFDINGDGTAEGSGKAGVSPVAVRLWVDPAGDGHFQRLLCAVIDNQQTVEHFGSGRLYMRPGVVAANVDPDYAAYVTWDRTDATHGWNEVYTAGTIRSGYKLSGAHVREDVVALAGGTVQKTIEATGTLVQARFGVTTLEFAARTDRGSGVALVDAAAPGSQIPPISGSCLSLQTQAVADGQCGGIDATGMDFLSAPTGSETQWPAGFAETPTF